MSQTSVVQFDRLSMLEALQATKKTVRHLPWTNIDNSTHKQAVVVLLGVCMLSTFSCVLFLPTSRQHAAFVGAVNFGQLNRGAVVFQILAALLTQACAAHAGL